MSGAISPSGASLAQLLIANSNAAALQVDNLTEESSSGLVSQNYAGLGEGAAVALNLQPQISRATTLQTGVTAATGPMTVAQGALTQINTLATGVIAQLANLNGLDPTAVNSVAASAQSALTQVAQLLNEQDAGQYVFAGQDSANPPVPDPSDILSSNFYTQINAAVSSLGSNGASATEATTLGVAASTAAGTSPFSATLEALSASGDGRSSVQIGVDQSVPGVMLANTNGDVASQGNTAANPNITTGSYMRDILRGLATIASFNSTTLAAPDAQTFIQDTQTSLTDATSTLSTDQGVLGDRQTQLTNTGTLLGDTVTALNTQVSNITDANLAQVATQLSNANTQLQASYQMIANVSKLSLVQYL
jgi:flagellar hook-associated protein 3 FlgL